MELENTNIYRVFPLAFGGFLAFDHEYIHCYKKKFRFKLVSRKLRKGMRIAAITQIDEYDPITKKTKEG